MCCFPLMEGLLITQLGDSAIIQKIAVMDLVWSLQKARLKGEAKQNGIRLNKDWLMALASKWVNATQSARREGTLQGSPSALWIDHFLPSLR